MHFTVGLPLEQAISVNANTKKIAQTCNSLLNPIVRAETPRLRMLKWHKSMFHTLKTSLKTDQPAGLSAEQQHLSRIFRSDKITAVLYLSTVLELTNVS